jgi:hypothetical protein
MPKKPALSILGRSMYDHTRFTPAFLVRAIEAGVPLDEHGPQSTLGNGTKDLIYFAACKDTVKVGFSVNPYMRIKDGLTFNPFQVTIIGVLVGGRIDEARIHAALQPRHIHAEWFHMNDALERIITFHTFRYNTSQTWAPGTKRRGLTMR